MVNTLIISNHIIILLGHIRHMRGVCKTWKQADRLKNCSKGAWQLQQYNQVCCDTFPLRCCTQMSSAMVRSFNMIFLESNYPKNTWKFHDETTKPAWLSWMNVGHPVTWDLLHHLLLLPHHFWDGISLGQASPNAQKCPSRTTIKQHVRARECQNTTSVSVFEACCVIIVMPVWLMPSDLQYRIKASLRFVHLPDLCNQTTDISDVWWWYLKWSRFQIYFWMHPVR